MARLSGLFLGWVGALSLFASPSLLGLALLGTGVALVRYAARK